MRRRSFIGAGAAAASLALPSWVRAQVKELLIGGAGSHKALLVLLAGRKVGMQRLAQF